MKNKPLNFSALPVRGFVRGYLEEKRTGQVVLKTRDGTFPVKLEGERVPLGQELVFHVLREEPGRLVLTPYRMETLPEALPFFKELFANEEATGIKLLLAAVQENLPLTREVLAGLKKGLLIAEREWGVQVHPRALAFLQARGIPLTPRTLLGALYTLFPAVQKVIWQKVGPKLLPAPVALLGNAEKMATRGEEKETAVQGKGLEDFFTEAVAFLRQQAESEPALPHFLFYLFPAFPGEVRWAGRKFSAPEQQGPDPEAGAKGKRAGFGFCLEYQSASLGRLQIIGSGDQQGIKLTVGAEQAVIDQNVLSGLGPYLCQKGWPVRSVEFHVHQGENGEELSPVLYPLRIDGWM